MSKEEKKNPRAARDNERPNEVVNDAGRNKHDMSGDYAKESESVEQLSNELRDENKSTK